MRIFDGIEAFREAEGDELGKSDWFSIDHERVSLFADATEDHQWIYVNPQRASTGPYGGTIAHGYLTLSLTPALARQVFALEGASMAINYGLNRVRFPAPVPVGANVRGVVLLVNVVPIQGDLQFTLETTIERQRERMPGCIAETIGRYLAWRASSEIGPPS